MSFLLIGDLPQQVNIIRWPGIGETSSQRDAGPFSSPGFDAGINQVPLLPSCRRILLTFRVDA
jgi:hypothetical protein